MAKYYKSFNPHVGGVKVRKVDDILTNLNRAVDRIKDRTLWGLIRAQARIYQEMDHAPPKIPVRYGNLRRSYFVATSRGAIYRGSSPAFTDELKGQGRLMTGHAVALLSGRSRAIQLGITKGPSIVFGFSAWYAPYVHEMYGTKTHPIHWTRPDSGPGFFSAAIGRSWNYILKIVAEEARKHERARR